jgi:non-specific serine/threonine protein kinase/serine/threonine-protein kinase
MSGTDWELVDTVFQAAIDLPATERATFLDHQCGGAVDVRAQVESLLAAHDASPGFLAPLGAAEDVAAPVEGPSVGDRIGAHTLVRELGRGGMGTVYLAARADGDFDHDVAIKVTSRPVSDPLVARRFQLERQVLASLHHPHIVTLIDGGTTPTGHAYLVMEYVQGSRITDWMRERSASLEDRLRLFRQVCSAVHAAHQHGIVHRDVKPANVLVTEAGVPKVLDFGIAKLLASGADAGVTLEGWGHGPLTPDYASPEQLRGLPITTAGDVYSLGVLLHELLAGARPYDTAGKTVDQVLEHVLHGAIRRVSAAVVPEAVPYPSSRLRGDLDAIVQKAMHVDPAQRYASAEELSDDVARFLGGKPIVAREPSLGYVLRKLASQHRAAVGVAVFAVLGIAAALGVALWQRQQALEQRARAEARFEDVRQLANALIFKVHDAVARLDGSTEARKLIVTEALGYLDTLATNGGDASLQLDLAKGYKQVARAQGDAQIANLGDYAGAHASLTRAIGILESLQSSALWRDAGLELVHALRVRASVEQSLGRRADAKQTAGAALAKAEMLLARAPDDREARRTLASAHFNVAMSLGYGPPAATHWEEAGRLFEALWKEAPRDPSHMRNVALVDKYYGGLLLDAGRVEEAVTRYRRALDLDEQRLASTPSSRQVQFDVAIDLANVAAGLARTDRREEAMGYYDRSLAMREAVLRADPKNRTARLVLVRALANAARSAADDSLRVRAYLDRAYAVAAEDPGLVGDRNHQRDLVVILTLEARLAHASGNRARACTFHTRARSIARQSSTEAEWAAAERVWFAATARTIGACGP